MKDKRRIKKRGKNAFIFIFLLYHSNEYRQDITRFLFLKKHMILQCISLIHERNNVILVSILD